MILTIPTFFFNHQIMVGMHIHIKYIYCLSFLLALSCNLLAQDNISLIVGTYTQSKSKGIYSFSFNQETGVAKPLDTLKVNNPSYLTIAMDGSMIYAVSETNDSLAAINVIQFDEKTGKMKLVNSLPTHGEGPCYVTTNGNLLLTANYAGGSMSVFPINIDGTLKPMSQQFKGSANNADANQQHTPHIHCARFLPDGEGVIATDFSADRLLRFNLVDMKQLGNATVTATLSKGSGPRHIEFSTDSRFVYVMSELSDAVTAYSYNFGKMRKIQEIKADETGAKGGADIHISPNGKFLYASNRLKNDGIAIFKINQKTGILNKVGYQQTGVHPRNFNITPNGKFLLCANRDSHTIQVFSINKATGLLTDTQHDIQVDMPVCVQFYPIVMQPDILGNGIFKVIEVNK